MSNDDESEPTEFTSPSGISALSSGWWDPLLTQISGPGKHQGYLDGGFKVMPPTDVSDKALRVVLLGNSSSLWPDYPFALNAYSILEDRGHEFLFMNGSSKGFTSAQELLRVVRDVPALSPNFVFSFSGICDLGSICLANVRFPFHHKYGQSVSAAVRKAGIAPKGLSLGVPDFATAAERWCRHHRQARVLCEDIGAKYVAVLQPTMGYGRYPMSPTETDLLRSKADVNLRSNGKTYIESVNEFYDGVRDIVRADPERHSHVLYWTDIFEDTPGAYVDHRHPSAAGCVKLGTELAALLTTELNLDS